MNNRTTSSHRLVQKLLIQLAIAPPTTAYNVGSGLACEATYVHYMYTALAHLFWYSTMAVVLGLATRDGENRSWYECLKVDLYTY